MQNVKNLIIKQVKTKGTVDSSNIAKTCGISRQAAHQHLHELVISKKILKIGTTRGSYYILFSEKEAKRLKREEELYKAKLINKNLQEDYVYDKAVHAIPSLRKLRKNIEDIVRYAFTEMLNNAIEHSGSEYIDILLSVGSGTANFDIVDRGIGIFKHVQMKFRLPDEYDALTEILKGKRTTIPSKHTGEGIFFTSKAADLFKIESSKISLLIDNKSDDIFTKEIKYRKGTKVSFQISKNAKKVMGEIFSQYTDSDYTFAKTKVVVKLYHKDVEYTSRSQARRLVAGLNKFKVIILDFKNVKTIGQGFADEIFRVFQSYNPQIRIESINCCKAVEFMIKRVKNQ
jgi:anti-sigma regulatory factor (Ser/Thr protein kinase)